MENLNWHTLNPCDTLHLQNVGLQKPICSASFLIFLEHWTKKRCFLKKIMSSLSPGEDLFRPVQTCLLLYPKAHQSFTSGGSAKLVSLLFNFHVWILKPSNLNQNKDLQSLFFKEWKSKDVHFLAFQWNRIFDLGWLLERTSREESFCCQVTFRQTVSLLTIYRVGRIKQYVFILSKSS